VLALGVDCGVSAGGFAVGAWGVVPLGVDCGAPAVGGVA
jgi:hypothetical protein